MVGFGGGVLSVINFVPTLSAPLAVHDPLPAAANEDVTGFAAALTRAVVTNNTLELANGTFFLDERSLGSKLFIRPCYKDLSEIILGVAGNDTFWNIVVTGTPGVGKSVFGFYLLYLLRCEGKTVVYERKDEWYRFSDEGAEKGSRDDFRRAGYLKDPDSWYMCDPQDRPFEGFQGITVVLVSPKTFRVKEFLKQAKCVRYFMGVWSLSELLECQRAIFPGVPSEDVEGAFGIVGGVARAVFDTDQLEDAKNAIEESVKKIDVGMLRAVASFPMGRMSTDDLGDSVFHIVDTKRYRAYSVTYASDFAKDLVVKQLSDMEARALAGIRGAAIRDPKLGEMLGGSVVGSLFEKVAHQAICGDPDLGETSAKRVFKMRVLTHAGSEDIVRPGFLSFSFTRRASFGGGNAFPSRIDLGPYYVPESPNFATIDSFGVDSSGQSCVLYFFQMKSAGFQAGGGPKLEEYWNVALSAAPTIKRCVLVYVVPAGEQWHKATKLRGRDWLEGATGGFSAVCDVCVIAIPLKN